MGVYRQFPYSNFHEMNMDEILKILKTMSEEWNATKAEWASYKDYIDNYFRNLDVSAEVLEALRILASTGELNNIIDPTIASATATWLVNNISATTGETVIDRSLTVSGSVADALSAGNNDKHGVDYTTKFVENMLNDYYPTFSVGAINISNGDINTATLDRMYSELLPVVPAKLRITPNYQAYIVYYDFNGDFSGNAGWITASTDLDTDYDYFRVMVRNSSVSDFRDRTTNTNILWLDNSIIGEELTLINSKLDLYYPEIFKGTLDITNGAFNPQTANRAITRLIPSTYKYINAKAGYEYYIIYYTEAGSWLISSGWKTGLNVIGNYPCYRLLIKNANISDFSNVENDFITIESEHRINIHEFRIRIHDNVASVLTEALKYKDSIVYVDPFEHDLIAEWKAFFGDSYFDNISSGDKGFVLGNNIKIIGLSGAKFTMHYTGNNTYVHSEFSMFNNAGGETGYTIDNIIFDTSNIRYTIHDEKSSDLKGYKVRISNCTFIHDNSESTWTNSRACIGGGLGQHGDVVIENCIFNTVTDADNKDALAYHNTASNTSKSHITITGNYFENDNTIQIASYGGSTDITPVLISNNSLGNPIEKLVWGSVDNMRVFDFNNVVRS